MSDNPLVSAAKSIENSESLDGAVDQVGAVVHKVFGTGTVRDVLHGAPLGHPAHPVAILIPAGAWISAAVLDFLPGQEKAARALVGVGVLSAAPAAASGIADWSVLRDQKQRRVGIVHWAANLTAVALYSASYVQRRRGRLASGKALSLAGLALISASGYLGGHLAYRQAANVESGDTELGADFIVDAGRLPELREP